MNTQSKDKYSDGDYQRAVGLMVETEVKFCVSTLISHLCSETDSSFAEEHYDILVQDDYETAIEDAGWVNFEDEHGANCYRDTADGMTWCDSEYNFCNEFGIEPYQREALEHWVVSDWLADRLEEHGEMIDRDVHSLTVWGRTTSGQVILMDRVICDIYDESHTV